LVARSDSVIDDGAELGTERIDMGLFPEPGAPLHSASIAQGAETLAPHEQVVLSPTPPSAGG
jgi:hypothetical protein